MARWGFKANKGAANVQDVALAVAAAASPRRAKVYDIAFGFNVSPADNAFLWIVNRVTTAGTGATLTPVALDTADTLASTIVCKDTITADGTLSGIALFVVPLNQRASFRWVAAPYGEIIIPATASNGIIVGLGAVTTTSADAGVMYEEL